MKKYKEAIPIFQESDRLDKIEMDSTHNRQTIPPCGLQQVATTNLEMKK
ncbi:MAG: hypothetical protein ACLUVY_05740 [Bacteroides uniformis]